MSRDLLVVDDDPFIRRLITTTLEDVAEFRLLEAQDGEGLLVLALQLVGTLDLLEEEIGGFLWCFCLEGGAVLGVLEGQVEVVVHGPDRFRHGEHAGQLQLTFN